MGFGKTLESLSIIDYFKKWPVLVLTKKTSTIVWKEEINRWMSASIRCRHGLKEKDSIEEVVKLIEKPHDLVNNEASNAEIFICNYTFFTEHLENFKEKAFKVLIADESHALKDRKSNRYKAVKSFINSSEKCEQLLLLSGTPALSSPRELYTQINLIDSTIFPDPLKYEQRYCDPHLRYRFDSLNQYRDVSGNSNLEELKLILELLMVRRDKRDFPEFFPKKTRQIVEIEMNDSEIEEEFQKYFKKLKRRANNAKKDKKMLDKLNKKLKTFYGRTCEAKIPGVFSKIKEILKDSNQKFIVVAHHSKMIDVLEDMCKKNNFEFATIHGRKSTIEREESLVKFKDDEDCKVMFLSYDTCSGLTLIGKFSF